MYEIIEFYDSNGYDLKEVLKSCIYKYYMNYNISSKVLKSDVKNSIVNSKMNMLSTERK